MHGTTAKTANRLLTSPILATLVRLSLPNMLAMTAAAAVAIAETVYVGLIGTPALAGMALVFPMVMLQQMMSAGAMGGGVSSAVSRALGAGDGRRADALALHATVIGAVGGLVSTALFVPFGPAIYRLLGGDGDALAEALAYSNVVFAGAAAIWFVNMFASVIRGAGNMKVPSAVLLAASALQMLVGGGLGLGLGPLPRLGMVGVAIGLVVAHGAGALFLLWYLMSGCCRVRLRVRGVALGRETFADILKVGALACVSSLQTVLTVLIVTRLVAAFGTETLAGYGIGARLEFLLIPITFAIGVACVPLVGMAIGAGDVTRARRIAWTSGTVSALILGAVGLVVAVVPDVWAARFSTDPSVLAAARTYLALAGPGYAFFGFGLCLYFSAQGAGNVLGPVFAGTARLVLIALGGWWLAATAQPHWSMFALVSLGMVVYGSVMGFVVYRVRWGGPHMA